MDMKGNRICLTENDIRKMVKETIKIILENDDHQQEPIEPTAAFVKQKYNEFNQLYFDGFLPKCAISVRPLGEECGRVLGGTFRFATFRNAILINGANLFYDPKKDYYGHIDKTTIYSALKPTITINSKYKAPVELLENTIIHEMCHYYTFFNEDGSFRIADKENKSHGQDFMNAAEMISRKSGGKVKIKAILEAEEIESMSASSHFNDDSTKICLADYNGGKILWYTKDHSIWVKFMYQMLKTDTIDITTDQDVLMMLKRYGYKITSWRNRKPNAYMLEDAPKPLIDAFNNAKFISVKMDEYDKFFKDDD